MNGSIVIGDIHGACRALFIGHQKVKCNSSWYTIVSRRPCRWL